MKVISVCPLSTSSLIWQPRAGSYALSVVCKATYALSPGEASLAQEQEEINESDDHWNDDPNRSVRAPSDVMPMKARAEVMVVGHAFAPGGQAVRSLATRLIVGEVDKAIDVYCDRYFTLEGGMQEGQRFTRMPLRYERAAGGQGTWNPVGMRGDVRDAYGRRALPNLQPAGTHVATPDDFVEPVGFGPIAMNWPTRVDKAGRHAQSFMQGTWRGRPVPDDFDMSFFNQAPWDQQLAGLRENERIVLEHMHPEHARLVTSLPGIRPAVFVDWGRGGAAQKIAVRADTLWIDTDRAIATMTFRAQIALEKPAQAGRVVVGMDSPGYEVPWSELERRAGLSDPSTESVMDELTVTPDEEPVKASPVPMPGGTRITSIPALTKGKSTVLPFAQGASGQPSNAPPAPPPALPFAQTQNKQSGTRDDRAGSGAPGSALPFGKTSSGLPFGTASSAVRAPSAPSWQAITEVSQTPQGTPPSSPRPNISPLPPAVARPRQDSVPGSGSWTAPQPPPVVAPPAPVVAPPAPVITPAVVQPPVVPVITAAPAVGSDSPWASGGIAPPPAPGRDAIAANAAPAISVSAGAASSPESAKAGGVAGASNAAAAATAPWNLPKRDAKAIAASAEPGPGKTAAGGREVLKLLWFDPSGMPRVRGTARWKPVLKALEDKAPDRELDDAAKEPQEVEDRREVFEILVHGERTDLKGIASAAEDAIRDDGKYIPPLVLLAGEMEFPFDEMESLRAAISTASPLITQPDENLRAAVTAGKEFLTTPGLIASPSVSEGLLNRIREAFVKEKKGLAPDYLDTQIERALLAGRYYQKREVLGGKHLRFLMRSVGEQDSLLGYIDEDVAKKLPMFKRFSVRLIAEVHLVEDQYETHPQSLRVIAIGRISGVAAAAPT